MAARPRVLVLLPATSYRARAFAEAGGRLGVDIVLGTNVPAAFFKSLGCDVLRVDLSSPEAALDGLARDVGSGSICGVLGTDELTAWLAAATARRLGLAGNDPEGVAATRDKRLMRERLARAGVPGPKVRILEPDAEARSLGELPYPVVVKPPMLSGSQGVIRANDERELAEATARIRAILERHSSPSRDDPSFSRLLVEDYLDGSEVAVEGLARNGDLEVLAIFDKPDDLTGPFFEETLYVTPTRLPREARENVVDVTRRAADALGIVHGAVHAELRVHESRASVLEVAARSIGGLCSDAFDLLGENLEERLVALAAGLEAPASGVGADAAGVMMLPIERSGVVRDVAGVDRAEAVPGVEKVSLSTKPGDSIRALPEGSSYLGFVFARGADPASVEASLRRAASCIEVRLSPLLNRVR